MHRARFLLLPLAAIVVVVALQLSQQPTSVVTPAAPQPASEGVDQLTDITPAGQSVAIAGVDTTDTDERIAYWQERLRTAPTSDTSWTYLGELYDLKGRQTGDLANYAAARDAFQKAVDISPSSAAAQIGLARIQATFHDFEGALATATAVVEAQPEASGALAIIFDSAYELGDLDIANLALTRLQERVESPAVTIRKARLAFLNGDSAAALELARRAADEAETRGDTPAGLAFFHYAVGEYASLAGDLDAADVAYRAALDALPGYSLAVAGQARVAYARGDLDQAIGNMEAAVAAVPGPDLVAYLGDLYALAGRPADADAQYATVDFIHELAAQDGAQVYDREYVHFLADHGRETALAVELARAELEHRQDVYGYDALAWALHVEGHDAEALVAAREALALGTLDAKLLIHAGLIEIANGMTSYGEAHLEQGLALNPTFSPLTIAVAREALGQ